MPIQPNCWSSGVLKIGLPNSPWRIGLLIEQADQVIEGDTQGEQIDPGHRRESGR